MKRPTWGAAMNHGNRLYSPRAIRECQALSSVPTCPSMTTHRRGAESAELHAKHKYLGAGRNRNPPVAGRRPLVASYFAFRFSIFEFRGHCRARFTSLQVPRRLHVHPAQAEARSISPRRRPASHSRPLKKAARTRRPGCRRKPFDPAGQTRAPRSRYSRQEVPRGGLCASRGREP